MFTASTVQKANAFLEEFGANGSNNAFSSKRHMSRCWDVHVFLAMLCIFRFTDVNLCKLSD